MVADELDAGGAGVAGDAGEVAVGLSEGEVGGLTVLKPVAFPATVPTFHEEASNIEAATGVDVFDGMFGAGAVTWTGSPSPFADEHGPPNAEELERFDPGEIT